MKRRNHQFFLLAYFCTCLISADPFSVDNNQAQQIGKKIWQNECGQSIDGLTSWNEGENFASLGIGHFIWYPSHQKTRNFAESFPTLINYMKRRGKTLPSWLENLIKTGCPWQDRDQFLKEFKSETMCALRTFLASTVDLQTQFMVHRFKKSIPYLLTNSHAKTQFMRMVRSRNGFYPLIDYVNFKGEGIKQTETYNGCGWGLLQVLQTMNGKQIGTQALESFAKAAQTILELRVANCPKQRNESRWLPGWKNRIKTYIHN